MHAVLLGASRGIGRTAALTLLESAENRVTLLLRNVETVKTDPAFKSFLSDGRVQIIQGDAYKVEDVRQLFVDHVDFVVFTLGRFLFCPHTSHRSHLPRRCIVAL